MQAACCGIAGVVLFCMVRCCRLHFVLCPDTDALPLQHVMTSDSALIAFAVLYGFFSGGFLALVSPSIVSISKDISEIGCVTVAARSR